MFSIALCEDEKVSMDYESSLINEWSATSGNKISLKTFVSAEQFLFESEDFPAFNLLIFDIQMKNMNGFELAEKLRAKGCKSNLIFITGITDYAIQGYEVGAVRYILKPVKKDILFSLLDEIFKNNQKEETECYMLSQGNEILKIPFNQIIYIEAQEHYVRLCGRQINRQWKSSFSEVSKAFEGKGFFLLRRGLMVNLSHIEQITRTECILDNEEKVPVARNSYKELNEAFINYYKK